MTRISIGAVRGGFTRRESGAVLVVSLIMLLLLTMIGVGGMRTTAMEERMAGNLRDQQLAFQAAETALRTGEALVSNPFFSGVGARAVMPRNIYAGQAVAGERDFWDKFNWAGDSAALPANHAVSANVAVAPRYVIEEVVTLQSTGAVDEELVERRVYRITARGVGQTPDAAIVLQSLFKL